MKRTDIVIGFEYAYARGDYEYDYGQAKRVRVTSLDGTITQGWGYSAKKVKGIEIEYLDADGKVQTTGTVASRTIREAWLPYAKRVNDSIRARRAADVARRKGVNDRAESLLHIIPALRHAGVEDSRGYTRNDEVSAAIDLHTPEIFVLNEDGGRTSHFNGPLAESYDDYIRYGKPFKISADLLLKVLR